MDSENYSVERVDPNSMSMVRQLTDELETIEEYDGDDIREGLQRLVDMGRMKWDVLTWLVKSPIEVQRVLIVEEPDENYSTPAYALVIPSANDHKDNYVIRKGAGSYGSYIYQLTERSEEIDYDHLPEHSEYEVSAGMIRSRDSPDQLVQRIGDAEVSITEDEGGIFRTEEVRMLGER